ncbi:MAG: Calx-beta domain-containing protein, partial [Bacteroidota bacterium]
MRIFTYIVFTILLGGPLAALAQQGPGGVAPANGSDKLVLWLRADSISGLANGDPIPSWADMSGYGHDATQAVAANQPSFIATALNGLPAVQLDGVDDYFDDAHSYDARTVFIVYNFLNSLQGTPDLGQLWGAYGDNYHIAIDTRTTNLNGFSFDGGNINGTSAQFAFNGDPYSLFVTNDNTTPVTRDTYQLVTAEFDATGSLSRQVIGGLLPNFSINDHNYGGQILEIIVFNSVLADPERIAVETYLAGKYNLTVANDAYGFDASHSYDLAGIGQANGEQDTQASSSSVLSLTAGAGLNADNEFLFLAHQNGGLTWTTTEAPDGGNNIERVAREWRLDETGELGAVTVEVDVTQLEALSPGYTKYTLLVDDNGDFSEGATAYEMVPTTGSLYGVDIDINDGQFVSIAAVRPVLGFSENPINEFESTDPTLTLGLNYVIHPSQTAVSVDYATQGTGSATGAMAPLNSSADDEDYEIIPTTTATIPAGSQSTSFVLNLNQDTQLEGDETLQIVLSGLSAGINLDVSILPFTINDDDNPREIYFATASSTVAETAGSLDVIVSLTSAFVDFTNPTTVNYAVTGGDATDGGVDFTLGSGTLTIPAGFVSETLTISLQDDALKETNETIVISLSSPTNSGLSTTNPIVHTVTITDNEVAPTVQFNLASSTGAEDSSPSIGVILSEVAGIDILVDYTITGTASEGADFTLTSGTLTIPAGILSASLAPNVIDDIDSETDETIVITLSNPQNATLGSTTVHTYTITDNDGTFGNAGPAGVGGDGVNTLWLKADDLTQVDGTGVSSWPDASGNTNDADQATAGNQPTFETAEINGQPVIRFDGNNDYLRNAAVSYNARTFFTVVRPAAPYTGGFGQVWGSYGEGAHLALDDRAGNKNGFSFDGNASTQGRYGLNGADYGALASNTNLPPWVNATSQLITAEFQSTQPLTDQTLGSTFPGHSVGSFHYGGDIAEVIVYNVALNTARRRIVENYLAAKYGLTISNDLFAYEGTHGHDVAGVGRESDGDHYDAQSAGILRISDPTSLDNGDYLLWGHDNAALTWSSTETPSDSLQRLAREWRVTETNDVGSVTVAIDTTLLDAKPTDYEGYALLVDDDGDFSNGGTAVYPLTQSGSEYLAAGVSIANGDYITVATTGITVSFAILSATGSETVTPFEVVIQLSRPSSTSAVSVDYWFDPSSTAVRGSDYGFPAGPISIPQGSLTTSFNLNIIDDGEAEADELIVMNITSISQFALGGQNQFFFTIQDDDVLNESISGPGGVRDSIDYGMWLRADVGPLNASSNPASNGEDVNVWEDQSGNNNDGIQAVGDVTTMNYPEYGDNPTDRVNGKPVLKFDGSNLEGFTVADDALINTGGPNFGAKTIMAAFETGTDVTTRQVIWEQGAGGNGAVMYLEGGEARVGIWSGSQGWDGDYTVSGAVSANSAYVVTLEFDGANQVINQYINALSQGSTATGNGILNTHGGDNGIGAQFRASQFGATDDNDEVDHFFTGKIMELLSINVAFGAAERLIVENYLAGKYGLVLTGNRLYDHGSTHSYDIAGIGQSALGEVNPSTRSTKLLTLSNASSLENGDYLMLGHDNADANTWATTDRPTANVERLAREWRISETNDVGTVRITLDTTQIAAAPNAGYTGRALLVDADGDFTSGATFVPLTRVGDNYVAEINLTDGQYLTVATVRPAVNFTQTTASSDENSGTVTLTVGLNLPFTSTVTVDYGYNVGSSTATEGAGNDFTFTGGTLTFNPGETEATFTFDILTDGIVESDETILFELSNPTTGLNLDTASTLTYSILDIDDTREVDFAVTASTASEINVTHNLTLRLNAVNGSQPTTVDYAVTGGTATGSGIDFTLAAGTATIPAGDLTTTITIALTDDAFNEADETVVVSLSNPVNAKVGTNATHTLTIIDNDDDPTVAFAAATGNGSESATVINIPVSLSNAAGVDITVEYSAAGITATDNVDFALPAGTLTIPAGSTSENLELTISDDGLLEVDETFTITLANPMGATLGGNTTFTYTINDNDTDGATGPGGVRDSSIYVFWLKSDVEVFNDSTTPTAAIDGETVQRWNDQSGNDRHGIGENGTEPLF